MYMAVAMQLQGLDCQGDIDGTMCIFAILDLARPDQRLFLLADKDQQLLRSFGYDFRPHKDVPEDFVRARHGDLGLGALAVDEQFDCFTGHCLLLCPPLVSHLRLGGGKCHDWCLHGQHSFVSTLHERTIFQSRIAMYGVHPDNRLPEF